MSGDDDTLWIGRSYSMDGEGDSTNIPIAGEEGLACSSAFRICLGLISISHSII